MLVAKDRGLMHNPVTFHEVFMFRNDKKPSKCDEYSTSIVTFTNARADGKILTPEIYLRDKYSECESISWDEYVEGGLRSWVKPGL